MRAVCLVALSACFSKPGPPLTQDGGRDAPPDSVLCPSFGPWGPAIELTGINASGMDDYEPALSGDNTRLIFYSDREADEDKKLWEATWNPDTEMFESPRMIQGQLTSFAHGGRLTPDGLTLWYARDSSGKDIARVERATVDSPFLDANAAVIAPFDNPTYDDVHISLSADLLDAVVMRSPTSEPYNDIFVTSRTSTEAAFVEPVVAQSLVDDGYACCASLFADGLAVLWEGSPGLGSYGVYYAERPARDLPFGSPMLFAPLDTPGPVHNGDPFISYDGTTLMFSRWDQNLDATQDFDLYMMRRTCAP